MTTRPTRPSLLALVVPALVAVGGCATHDLPPMPVVPQVDLPRFMGDWYVIASIPTFIERGAHNAVESYRLEPDGTIATTFRFRAGGFDGEEKRYEPTGYVREGTGNAVWGMQFIWPFKAEYLVSWLDPDYRQVIIGRNARDYVWIMAREPVLPEADYQRLVAWLGEQGYDVARIARVPQRWP